MTYAKPKTKPKPVDRQAHNQREYERLLAEVKSHLEHRSPGIWDWVSSTATKVKDAVSSAVKKVSDWAGSASKKIDERTGGAWETASAPIIAAGYNTGKAIDKGITAVGEWGNRKAVKAGDAYDKGRAEAKGLADEAVGRTERHVVRGGRDVAKSLRDDTDKVEGDLTGAGETITNLWTGLTEAASDIINNISITLGVGMEAAWAALGGLPDLLTTFKDELAAWFTFDAAEFNTIMAKLRETMKLPEVPEHPAEWRK